MDFIDNRLAQYVQAFDGNTAKYDFKVGYYVPTEGDQTEMQNPKAEAPRPRHSEVMKMTLWDTIFTTAMKLFLSEHPNEPKKRRESGFSIRELSGWDGVNDVLQRAKETFEHPVGIRGHFGVAMRKTVINSQRITGALALVPEVDFTSGVLSVVRTLLAVRSLRVWKSCIPF